MKATLTLRHRATASVVTPGAIVAPDTARLDGCAVSLPPGSA